MFFFFKRKTAYELRISDWSSDVCSSDLLVRDYLVRSLGEIGRAAEDDRRLARACDRAAVPLFLARHEQIEREVRESAVGRDRQFERIDKAGREPVAQFVQLRRRGADFRSEERRLGNNGGSPFRCRLLPA